MSISKKTVNYFSSDAHRKSWANFFDYSDIVNFGKAHDGLWIGGNCELFFDRIELTPNSMNNAVHSNLEKLIIPINRVEEIHLSKNIFMDTLCIEFAGTELKLKCYGAQEFKDQINRARIDYKNN